MGRYQRSKLVVTTVNHGDSSDLLPKSIPFGKGCVALLTDLVTVGLTLPRVLFGLVEGVGSCERWRRGRICSQPWQHTDGWPPEPCTRHGFCHGCTLEYPVFVTVATLSWLCTVLFALAVSPLKSLASCSSPSRSASSGRGFDTLHRHQYFPQLITLLWLLCSSVRGALVSDFPSPIALALLAPYAVKFPIGRAFVGRAFPLGVRHLEK